jgi:serine/threonine protein kinase
VQDFAYLKALEFRNVAPKKAGKKLKMPDISCKHMVKMRFTRTGEATFQRIFQRPIGQKCFAEFLKDATTEAAHPTWLHAYQFWKETEGLKSEKPTEALEVATELKRTYIDAPLMAKGGSKLWTDPALRTTLDERMVKLAHKATEAETQGATIRKKKNLNLKEFFAPFITSAKAFLSGEAFTAFQASSNWVRYMQWKQLELNTVINERDFNTHRILGRGGFGEVYGSRKFDTGALFAMKKLDKKRLKAKGQESSAVHERNVLSEMHSKFVTKLKYSFHDKDALYLLLDLCEGGDLNWHLNEAGTFPEETCRFYAAQIVMGLAHIHDKEMVYRDLKPANILLNAEGNALISDLGLVRDIKKGRSLPTSECGTCGYMSPEVIEEGKEYSYPSDWFTLGVTIFEFFTGYTPFRGPKEGGKERHDKVEEVNSRTAKGLVEYPDEMPEAMKDLIMQLLEVDPAKRLGSGPPPTGAQQIRAHPWFHEIDWQALSDHKLDPPIVPDRSKVNASEQHMIERFDYYETRKVKVTKEEDHKYYHKFDYVMSHSWQDEVLAMYDVITKETDLREAATEKARAKIISSGKGFMQETVVGVGGGSTGTASQPIMEGIWLKQSGLMKSWNPRYVRLYEDRLTVAHDDVQKEQKIDESLAGVVLTLAEQKGLSPSKPFFDLTFTKADGQPIGVFRTLSFADHAIWLELLEHAIAHATADLDSESRSTAKQKLSDATGPKQPGKAPRQSSVFEADHMGLSAEEKSRALSRLNSEAPGGGGGPASPDPAEVIAEDTLLEQAGNG